MDENIIKIATNKLERINPNDQSSYEKTFKVLKSIGKIPVLITKLGSGTPVFRSRTHKNETQLYERISDIFITPKDKVQKFGRCNAPKNSIFYTSENRPISYIELVKDWFFGFKDDERLFVTIGKWITQKELNLVIVTSPDMCQRMSSFDQFYGNYLDEYIDQFPINERKGYVAFYKYLFGKFSEDSALGRKNTYLVTSAYCDLAISLSNADGILYPSVPSIIYGMNVAFKADIANFSNFKLNAIYRSEMIVIKEDGKTHFKEIGIRKATSFDIDRNSIRW